MSAAHPMDFRVKFSIYKDDGNRHSTECRAFTVTASPGDDVSSMLKRQIRDKYPGCNIVIFHKVKRVKGEANAHRR